jgi:hypothetical protein
MEFHKHILYANNHQKHRTSPVPAFLTPELHCAKPVIAAWKSFGAPPGNSKPFWR